MRLAEIRPTLIHDIAQFTFAFILPDADAIQTGQIAVRHTLSTLTLPIVSRGTFASVGRNATAILTGSV